MYRMLLTVFMYLYLKVQQLADHIMQKTCLRLKSNNASEGNNERGNIMSEHEQLPDRQESRKPETTKVSEKAVMQRVDPKYYAAPAKYACYPMQVWAMLS